MGVARGSGAESKDIKGPKMSHGLELVRTPQKNSCELMVSQPSVHLPREFIGSHEASCDILSISKAVLGTSLVTLTEVIQERYP